jgi:uncharacterized repeat protein (TIGR03803 family)
MSAQGNRGWAAMKLVPILMMLLAAIAAPAQTFKSLVNFDGTDGSGPYFMSLVQGADGSLYGVTFYGGANNLGTVFKVTPAGTLTTLHSFAGYPTDGAHPGAGLVLSTDGDFYGTTEGGGANNDGTVFRITPSGTLTTQHSFDSTDGELPDATLVQATNGNLYGTTYQGGTSTACVYGCGTVFSVAPGGRLTTLHSFAGYPTDGATPYGALIQATDGNLYGTTLHGGTGAGTDGPGTLFEITLGGTLTTLHSFDVTDGTGPSGGLVQSTSGNFYGTTNGGGANDDGTVFKATPEGTVTTLYSFDGTDGDSPEAGLVLGTDGSFYGPTSGGGANGYGTVFKITPGGALTTLHSFDLTDGSEPADGLVQATNGTFYGANSNGGANSDGTVFSLAVGLRAFIEPDPTSGKVGSSVTILGTKLTGASSVTFNGIAASYKVVSGSEITTMVPTGATTGPIQVVTPSGTLTGNVSFQVLP